MANALFLHDSPFEYTSVLMLVNYANSKGHNVDILIKSEEGKHFWDKVRDFKPDCVAFSISYGLHNENFALAREAKNRLETITIAGGPYVTYFSDCINREEIDVAVRGEGEEVFLDFLNALDNGEDYSSIANVMTKSNGLIKTNPLRPLVLDLDKYPVLDRKYYYKYPFLRNKYAKQFMTGRGCPYHCHFCFNHRFHDLYKTKGKEKVRQRSPELMIEELVDCKSRYPMKDVVFNDDIFTFNIEWLSEFAPLYKKHVGVGYGCQIRPNLVTEESARLLAESNCRLVMVGLESGNPRVRKEVMGKKFSNEQFYKGSDILHEYGIKIKCFNILGCPTETLDEAFDTIEANQKAKIDYPWCAIYQAVPGTRTFQIAVDNGCIDENLDFEGFKGSVFSKSLLTQPEIKEVERAQKIFYFAAMNKRLIPIFKKLVRYNLPWLFVPMFFLATFLRFKRETGATFWNTCITGIKHLKDY